MFSTGRLIGGVALVIAAAGGGWAQPTAPTGGEGALGSLRVPGTTAALARATGIDGSGPRGQLILDVIRVAYENPLGFDAELDERRGSLRGYLVAVSDVERARRALKDGRLSASLAQAKATRRPVEDFARAIGGKLDEADGRYRIALSDGESQKRRQQWVQNAGLDIDQLARDFNKGATVIVSLPSDEIPLPLDVEAWTRLVEPTEELSGCVMSALIGDRRASLLYFGLLSLDPPTRAYLASNRPLLEKLLEGPRPSVIATFGRSIRVRGGRVDVPGGARAVPLWEALVDRRVSEPERFILDLLERDGGRLALLYDATDHLDPPRQTFALGLRTPDAVTRVERLKALYTALEPALVAWDVEARPFSRVAFDGVHVLLATRVLPSGELPSPAGRRFWQTVFASAELPREPARDLRSGEADIAADAAWLVEQLCVQNMVKRRQLVSHWLFGQRAFAGVAPAALPDVLVALRGFQRSPMLLLTLERMGITDPATYAVSVRRAQRLREIGNRDVAMKALCQFQGALAMIERVRVSRAITAQSASQLVGTLSAVSMTETGEFQGKIAAWMEAYLLPALPTQAGRSLAIPESIGPIEAALLTAMTRPGAAPAKSAPVAWEGLHYRVDVGAAELARLTQVRQKQGGYAVDAVLAYCREVNVLPQTLTAPSGVPAREAALVAVTRALGTPVSTAAGSEGPTPNWRELLEDAARELRKIKKPKDLARVERIATPLRRAGDWLLAKVLVSLAYAPHLGDPEGPALMAGDPAQRHDFGLGATDENERGVIPWRLPKESFGDTAGWRATGSVTGLDVGLARLALRRVAADSLPPPPAVNDNDRAALTAVVAFINPFDVTDAEPSAVADAIRRGRARISGLSAHPTALSHVLRVAPVGEWREQVLPWVLEREPDRILEYFSLVDLVRVGEAEATPVPPLDAWGTSALATEGCLCLRYPGLESWETFAGRIGTSLVVDRVPDLTLRVAESLATLGLPAQLVRAVMAVAVQDVLDQYQPAFGDDWAALVATVRRIPDGRLEDYIAALTSGGPLIATDRESTDHARR